MCDENLDGVLFSEQPADIYQVIYEELSLKNNNNQLKRLRKTICNPRPDDNSCNYAWRMVFSDPGRVTDHGK